MLHYTSFTLINLYSIIDIFMLSIQYSFFTKAVCDLFMSMCTLSNNADMLKFDDEMSESNTISQQL